MLFSKILRPHPTRGRLPSLEIHIPLSAQPSFLRQVWLLVQSARLYGGEISRKAQFHLWLSRDLREYSLEEDYPWILDPAIHYHWVAPELFDRHWYYGTAVARGDWAYSADLVAFLDADTLIVGSLDELLQDIHRFQYVCGFQAHIDPFAADPGAWQRLFAQADLPKTPFSEHASGANILSQTHSHPMPAYWNLGVILGTGPLMQQLGAQLHHEIDLVNAFTSTVFRCQLAITLRLYRSGISWRQLTHLYNHPNYSEFDHAYQKDENNFRIIHYLGRSTSLNKDEDFSSQKAFADFLQRPQLHGSNALVQRVMGEIGDMPGTTC